MGHIKKALRGGRDSSLAAEAVEASKCIVQVECHYAGCRCHVALPKGHLAPADKADRRGNKLKIRHCNRAGKQ